jgi:hypothetical protein
MIYIIMPDKKVDGIRKLSKEEVKRSRKIVLDSIGEGINLANVSQEIAPVTRKEADRTAVSFSAAKKVDGIKPKDAAFKQAEKRTDTVSPVKEPEKQADAPMSEEEKEKIRKWREKAKKVLPFGFRGSEPEESGRKTENAAKVPDGKDAAARLFANHSPRPRETVSIPKKADAIRRKFAGEKDKGIVNFIMRNYTEKKETAAVPPTAGKRDESAKKARIGENKRLERIKMAREREYEKKRLSILREQERRQALKEKARKRSRRRQIIGEAKRMILYPFVMMRREVHPVRLFSFFLRRAEISAKKASYIFVIAMLAGILLYSFWLVAALKFNLYTPVGGIIASYVPTPAIVTPDGIIDYNTYNAIKANISDNGSDASVKSAIARIIVIGNLAEKYNIPYDIAGSGGIITDELRDELSQKIIYDVTINQVGINRIGKIKQLIDKNGDFVRTANTYGDDQGQIDISDDNRNSVGYASEIADLNTGEVSDVIFTPEGYYIFKCYEKTETDLALSYVFVKAKTLDQYINEAVLKLKMWSWVD